MSMDEGRDNLFHQAEIYFSAMGELVDASELGPARDAHLELTVVLTRAEIAAMLPLLAAAETRAGEVGDPWADDQRQWWRVTQSRLKQALGEADEARH